MGIFDFIKSNSKKKRKKKTAWERAKNEHEKFNKAHKKIEKSLKSRITNLLKEKNIKMPASDIDAHLKF